MTPFPKGMKWRARAPIRTACKQCGGEFYRQKKSEKFCSDVCRLRFHGQGEKKRGHYIKRVYGLSHDDVSRMLAEQNGCAICHAPIGIMAGDAAIDHCHSTGMVRGILCHRCNTALGLFRDDSSLMASAAEYIELSKSKTAKRGD